MNDTRKRPGGGRVHTVLGFLILCSWSAMNGCSSSDGGTTPDNTGGTGGGGGAACGTNVNDPQKYPQCSCSGSRCVPKTLVASGVANLLSTCDQGVCVPDNIVAQGQNLQLKKCTSISGAEGRCASTCIGAVANLSGYLPQADCAQNERCAPCFSPADGTPTGICGLGCDASPTSQPVKWDACCQGAGLCAPKSALPQALAAQLGPETCKNASTDVCVPAKPIQNPTYRFPCCTISLPNDGGTISGACAPKCIIDQGPAGTSIPRGSCGADEKCVPCADPISGNPTGVCTDTAGTAQKTCTP